MAVLLPTGEPSLPPPPTHTFTPTEDERIVLDEKGNRWVDVRMIVVAPGRGRKDFKTDMLELMQSIKTFGVLMPILLRFNEKGELELVAGERRLRATILNSLQYIPAIIKDRDSLWAAEAELEENVEKLRRKLDWPEECAIMARIHDEKVKKFGAAVAGRGGTPDAWSPEKTAALTGKSKTVVHDQLKMHKLLKSRPDIGEKIKNLDFTQAMKQAKHLQRVEDTNKKIQEGKIVVEAKILRLDALQGLATLGEKTVDCILTDPPFGASSIEQSVHGSKSMSFTSVIQDTDNLSPELIRPLLSGAIKEFSRVMKTGAHLYMFFSMEHYQFLVEQLEASEFIVGGSPLIWYKDTTVNAAQGWNFPSSYEPILFAFLRERTRRLQEPPRNVITCKPVPKDARLHKFQKPEILISTLLATSTIAGDLVVDPFAGSGAIVKTAHQLGRRALGFEINEANHLSSQINLSVLPSPSTENGTGATGGVK